MLRHISTSIEGLLMLRKCDLEALLPYIKDDDGRSPSLEEFVDAIIQESAMGHKFLRTAGCDNFDPVKGCLGHKPATDADESSAVQDRKPATI